MRRNTVMMPSPQHATASCGTGSNERENATVLVTSSESMSRFMVLRLAAFLALALTVLPGARGCSGDPCRSDADCPTQMKCNLETNVCVEPDVEETGACQVDNDCTTQACVDGVCAGSGNPMRTAIRLQTVGNDGTVFLGDDFTIAGTAVGVSAAVPITIEFFDEAGNLASTATVQTDEQGEFRYRADAYGNRDARKRTAWLVKVSSSGTSSHAASLAEITIEAINPRLAAGDLGSTNVCLGGNPMRGGVCEVCSPSRKRLRDATPATYNNATIPPLRFKVFYVWHDEADKDSQWQSRMNETLCDSSLTLQEAYNQPIHWELDEVKIPSPIGGGYHANFIGESFDSKVLADVLRERPGLAETHGTEWDKIVFVWAGSYDSAWHRDGVLTMSYDRFVSRKYMTVGPQINNSPLPNAFGDYDRSSTGILLHEFFHSYGCEHVPPRGNIMHGGGGEERVVNGLSLDAICEEKFLTNQAIEFSSSGWWWVRCDWEGETRRHFESDGETVNHYRVCTDGYVSALGITNYIGNNNPRFMRRYNLCGNYRRIVTHEYDADSLTWSETGAICDYCGDEVISDGETCDGDCPTACDDGDVCTTDTLLGSPDTCSASCNYAPISACQNDDGCCPAGCAADQDNDCQNICEGDYVIDGEDTQGDLERVAGCNTITGNLTIRDTDLTTLDGLNALRFVGGDLVFSQNSLLPSVGGLNALTSIGGTLAVVSNGSMTTIGGLNALSSVGANVLILFNHSIVTIAGLDALTSVGAELKIGANTSLAACEAVRFKDRIGQDNIEGGIQMWSNNGTGTCD